RKLTTNVPYPTATEILSLAESLAQSNARWGNENCTGFVFSISWWAGAPFFYASNLNPWEASQVGPTYGNPPHLLNDTHNGYLPTDPGFASPVIGPAGIFAA